MKNILKIILTLLLSFNGILVFAQNATPLLFVGTYTTKTSEGIYVYRFNTETGDFTPAAIAKGIANPSFLAISPDQNFLYATDGLKGDSVRAFSINAKSGDLTVLNTQPTGGIGAVHMEVDKTGKWLLLANYRSGSLNVFPIQTDGSLGTTSQTIQHEGKSIDPERQTKPYVHSVNVAPNNVDVFVPDLGTDKIVTYALDAKTGTLSAGTPPFTAVTPGSGPRHFTIHPNGKFAYVIQEMGSTITGFNYKNGKLEAFQIINSLPDDYKGRKWGADIHISPDGKFLYSSNRAHESIGIFSIHRKTGKLTLVGHQSVNGKTPRNFAIDPSGNFILVANQDSDNVTIFKRDKKTGKMTATGKEMKISMPVCLKFMH